MNQAIFVNANIDKGSKVNHIAHNPPSNFGQYAGLYDPRHPDGARVHQRNPANRDLVLEDPQ